MVVKCVKVDNAFLNYVGCSVSWFSPKPTEKEKPGTLVFGHGVVTAGPRSCSTVGNEVQPCLGLRDRGLFRQLSPSLTTHLSVTRKGRRQAPSHRECLNYLLLFFSKLHNLLYILSSSLTPLSTNEYETSQDNFASSQ